MRRHADRLMRDRLKARFIITTTTGEAFDGLLSEIDERTVVLVNVGVVKDVGSVAPVDGEVILRRDAIAYMQKP